jgi:hypothetical protein
MDADGLACNAETDECSLRAARIGSVVSRQKEVESEAEILLMRDFERNDFDPNIFHISTET